MEKQNGNGDYLALRSFILSRTVFALVFIVTFGGLAVMAEIEEGFLKKLEAWADMGDTNSLRRLGYVYSQTEKADHFKAFTAFEKAAGLGDAESQFMLGKYYLNGWGRPVDLVAAEKWFSSAVTNHHIGASFELSLLYEKRDDLRCLQLFVSCAEHGMTSAQAKVGFFHKMGKFVGKDEVLAYAWWRIAADDPDDNLADELLDRQEKAVSKEERLNAFAIYRVLKNRIKHNKR